MKKIILGLLIALMAFAFMGCPTVYDTEYDEAKNVYYVGDSNDWKWDKMACSGNIFTITVTVEEDDTFKLTPNENWDEEWNDANLDLANSSAAASLTKTEEFGKYKTTFAEAGTYTITMDLSTELYTISK
ncbi:MAG: SusF/SusE family outer membrane protein [Spirochaetaceae bacterium]|nr:SusF/SusE family outer membrane protein [Spirochaetaceae bacterium]